MPAAATPAFSGARTSLTAPALPHTGFLRRAHQLDPARLAAPAGVDLRFHRPELAAESRRDRLGLRRGVGDAARLHRHAVFRQQLLRLVLVDVHRTLKALWPGLTRPSVDPQVKPEGDKSRL